MNLIERGLAFKRTSPSDLSNPCGDAYNGWPCLLSVDSVTCNSKDVRRRRAEYGHFSVRGGEQASMEDDVGWRADEAVRPHISGQ